LHSHEKVLAASDVHDAVGLVAGDVEVDLSGGFLAWPDGGWVHALGSGDSEQSLVRLAALRTGVEVRNDRCGGTLDGLVGCRRFPQRATYLMGDDVRTGFQIANSQGLNDVPVNQFPLGSDCLGGGFG
jgi:hypothetical protein